MWNPQCGSCNNTTDQAHQSRETSPLRVSTWICCLPMEIFCKNPEGGNGSLIWPCNIITPRAHLKMAWRLRTLVACMCWLLGLTGSIKLELGFIYLTLSGIAGILMSLEDDPGRSGPSAYSVFNPNNEQLAGTLDARHIDAAIKNQT